MIKHAIGVAFVANLFPNCHVPLHPANIQLSACKGAVQDFIRGETNPSLLNVHESSIQAKPCDEVLAVIQPHTWSAWKPVDSVTEWMTA